MKIFDCNKHKWQDCECVEKCRRGNKEIKTNNVEIKTNNEDCLTCFGSGSFVDILTDDLQVCGICLGSGKINVL